MHRLGEAYAAPRRLLVPAGLFMVLLALALVLPGLAPAQPRQEPFNPSQKRMTKFDAQAKVREYLKRRLENPDTYKETDWSELVKLPGDGPYIYAIRHFYWAKPQYGPIGWADNIFYFDAEGEIAGIENIAPGKSKPMKHRMRPE